jgi:L-seryl-tRNA(Ser) seleniumtransferase
MSRPPRMDALLAHPEAASLKARFGAAPVKRALASALEEARPAWLSGGPAPTPEALLHRAAAELGESFGGLLRRVVNGTGVVLHTNLGRAPLPKSALDMVADLLPGYVDLEVDLGSRARGHRDARLERSLQEWLDTDRAAIAVNNNAAAVLLMLSTLSAGKETVVSRGELVEIGGGFRVPEVMAASGARLREVGTTNRTRIADYRRAAGPQTGMLLKVHPSNYRVVGFTEEVPLGGLAALGRELGLAVGYDWGTGLASDGAPLGLQGEETLREALAAGPDVLTFSTDKLFGACQGGLLLMAPHLAEAFRNNPLLRALRADKVTYALLGATLDLYRRGRTGSIPALAMLSTPEKTLRARALRLKRDLERRAPGRFDAAVLDAEGRAGGGSAPLSPLPSPALALVPEGGKAEDLEAYLRTGGEPPVLGVLGEGRLLIHLRTLLPGDSAVLLERLAGYGGRP